MLIGKLQQGAIKLKSIITNLIGMILLFISICFLVIACGRHPNRLSNSNQKNDLLTIDDKVIDTSEIMLYLLEARLEFEQIGGEDIWESDGFSSGKNAEEVAKNGAIENIIKTKIVMAKAEEIGITLSSQEEEDVKQRSADYYNQLDDTLIEPYTISMDTVYKVFREALIRSKVVEEVTKTFEPEEAKINEMLEQDVDYITLVDKNPYDVLTQIHVKLVSVEFDEENQQELKQLADEIYSLTQSDTFQAVIERYKEDDRVGSNLNTTLTLYQIPEENREEILMLQSGESSTVIKLSNGYYIFWLESLLEPTKEQLINYQEQYKKWEDNKIKEIKEGLKLQAFNEIYSEWKNTKTIIINEAMWDETSIHGIIQ